jgi:hypothetical protein
VVVLEFVDLEQLRYLAFGNCPINLDVSSSCGLNQNVMFSQHWYLGFGHRFLANLLLKSKPTSKV